MIIKYYLYGKLSNQLKQFQYEDTSTPRHLDTSTPRHLDTSTPRHLDSMIFSNGMEKYC